ncbi:MAG: hypothetical protein ISR44_04465 [Rhodospirillales bacterium]|nr:hypothetical protein [Rhodospirillales bacterium]
MGRVARIFIGFAVAVSIVQSAQANSLRTDRLLEKCNGADGKPQVSAAYCVGWMSGFVDALKAVRRAVPASTPETAQALVCPPPPGISTHLAIQLFLKYAADHPHDRHEDAGTTVLMALRKAFPCA